LSTASIFGISAGSLFGGDYVQSLGPKKTIIIFNVFGLIGSIMSLQLSFKLMCLGRFFFGLTSGVLLCATSRVLEDTIPVRLIDKGFGTSTNILMQLFTFMLLLTAIGMPDNRDQLETTRWWRCIYGL
jgi:MFS family permease